MKAMILAAGLGTRLRPITDARPKALVEIDGRTLLEITLTRLRAFGIQEVIINVHHFAQMVVDYLKTHDNFGMRIEISREDDLLLDTGGGLKKAAWFFLENAVGEPFLLHNVDVISNIDFSRMLQFHNKNHALATLAVQDRESSRYLLFDENLQLCGRRIHGQDTLVSNSAALGAKARVCHPERSLAAQASEGSAFSLDSPLVTRHSPLPTPLAFSGIHILSPRILPLLTETGVFSIIGPYLRLAAQGEKILAFRADHSYWRDLGRPSDLTQAALDLHQKPL